MLVVIGFAADAYYDSFAFVDMGDGSMLIANAVTVFLAVVVCGLLFRRTGWRWHKSLPGDVGLAKAAPSEQAA